MAEYHVGCGIAGIYAGIKKSEEEWKSKSDVTDEATAAVAEYLLNMGLRMKFTRNNKVYDLHVSEEEHVGKWLKISPAGIYECSECGQAVMTSDIDCYKFCHGCGAKMEGQHE